MLEHMKRQDKWRILQHALSSYVYNRSLFAVFTRDFYIHDVEEQIIIHTHFSLRMGSWFSDRLRLYF